MANDVEALKNHSSEPPCHRLILSVLSSGHSRRSKYSSSAPEKLAAIPLVVDICVALYSTKIVALAKNGVWSTLHEARTDVSMLLGLVFLLLVGGGTLSVDALRKAKSRLD